MSSVEVRFIDYDQTLADVRTAVAEAKAARPEIAKVYLFGSLVRGEVGWSTCREHAHSRQAAMFSDVSMARGVGEDDR